jgi:hypothetical protein
MISSTRYVGPNFWDWEIQYFLPPARNTEWPRAPDGDYVNQWFNLRDDQLTPDQWWQLRSIREFCRDFAEVHCKGHPVYVDFLSRPFAAKLMADAELTAKVVAFMDQRFARHSRARVRPGSLHFYPSLVPLWDRIIDTMAANGWDERSAAQELRGRPKPRF